MVVATAVPAKAPMKLNAVAMRIAQPGDRARVATEVRYRLDGQEVVVETHEPTKLLHELTGRALAEGKELESLEVRRPTLEAIYLSLTGSDE